MGNKVSFATDVINAIPECIGLYLVSPDIIIPNVCWKREMSEVNRLADLEKIGFATAGLAESVARVASGGENLTVRTVGEENRVRNLFIARVDGSDGVLVMQVRDETEVRRVEQMRKDFIANVSHELRTPLTAVKGYIETLLDPQFLTMERVRQFLPVIFEHTERLHNLMLDLLSLSRLENPNTQIQLSPISLEEQVQDAVEAVTPLARMKNVHLQVRPVDNVMVLANSEHMERILVNLLDNAIKYSDSDAVVEIWTEVRGDKVWTHVKDDGPGIVPEEAGRVFERFYRTRSALSGRARGSGLGLAIVKHIVQQLGGEIGVSSSPGQGSNFYFSLKIARTEETPEVNVLGHKRPQSGVTAPSK